MKNKNNIPSYNHKQIESKCQKKWEEVGLYKTSIYQSAKPYYNLMMYPYPSAEGLHVGNVYAFVGSDIHGRYHKMTGFNVFEPIGFDSGGIHSENFAIKMGVHPKVMTARNIANFTKQLKKIGNMFDWDHSVDAMDPDYYKWTQWIFTQLFKAGLAYKKDAPVTWCPGCKTTVSDEQTEKQQVTADSLQLTENRNKIKNQPASCKLQPESSEVTVCERCKTPIERRQMKQWFFKITDYADRLLANTHKLNWPSKILATQRNWIGKSEGALIQFSIFNFQFSNTNQTANSSPWNQGEKSNETRQKGYIEVFTTRPDTLHGCTYLVLAPEHPLVLDISKDNYEDRVKDYVKKSKAKTEQERKIGDKAKTGVFTGTFAVNPVNGKQIPIWVADYVLMEYGEGAVMGVPMHDLRDYDFAKKYGLEMVKVIAPVEKFKDQNSKIKDGEDCYEGEGLLINSNEWNGWRYPQDLSKVISWLEKKGIGRSETTFKLRDWNISRQRYWGPPIPMIFCQNCADKKMSWFQTNEAKEFRSNISNFKFQISNLSDVSGWYPVPDDQLPVILPEIDDYLPDGSGKAPLARHPEFITTTCPHCGGKAIRETDVSDTFMDSSWYFLRYPSTAGGDVDIEIAKKSPFDADITKKWLPVTQYCGGAEHSVLHLMYSRFIWMVLYDLGYVNFSAKGGPATGWEEPFPNFYAHGLLIKDGAKMSKSRGNIINPDEYIEKYGTDVLRLYLSFMGPYADGGDFRDSGIAGMQRFLRRIWTNFQSWQGMEITDDDIYTKLEQIMHLCNQKVTRGIKQFKYNTAIAALMQFMNAFEENKSSYEISSKASTRFSKLIENYLLLLAPFAPHITEELWQVYQKSASRYQSIHNQSWPILDEKKLIKDKIIIAIQINGKLRGTIEIDSAVAMNKTQLLEQIYQLESIAKYIKGKKIIREIIVPRRLINLVVE